MKFYYKERTAKNQCKVLSEEKGMLTIQMRNGGRFLVSKRNIVSISDLSESDICEAEEIPDAGPGQTWLKKNGSFLQDISEKLKKFEEKFEKDVQYDPNEDPHTEAVHSVLVSLWSIVGGMSHGKSFESTAKEMIMTGKYMLRELV